MGDAALRQAGLDLGRVGIWTFDFDRQPIAVVRASAAALEELGYRALWVPELAGREAFSQAALLLAATRRMVIVSAIARIVERSARAMVGAQRALAEAYPGRYLLGLGYGGRRDDGVSPVVAMRAYLDEMDSATIIPPAPSPPPARLLAAYGPAMVRLAAERSAGVHTYKVTTEHTAEARAILGLESFLAPEHAVVLETAPTRARQIARAHLETYLRSPFNLAKFRRLGYADEDFAAGGSDRLVDALIAWGDLATVVAKLQEHFAAGADHVGVQVLGVEPGATALSRWRLLAEALLA